MTSGLIATAFPMTLGPRMLPETKNITENRIRTSIVTDTFWNAATLTAPMSPSAPPTTGTSCISAANSPIGSA